jgi:sugar lactone lactonase YvrE
MRGAETPEPVSQPVGPTSRDRPRVPGVVITSLALLGLAVPSPAEPPDRDTVRQAYAAARQAHEEKDYTAFLLHSRTLVELAPRSTFARYNLACGQSLTGDTAGALASLNQLADWEVAFDLAADTDLDPIRDTGGFRRVAARMAALEEPVGGSPVAFTVPERDLLAEGVAHDPETGAFFVTGVHRRKVVRVDTEGRVSDFVAEGQGGLFSAAGVVVDSRRRALWVTTEAGPLMRGFEKGAEGRSLLLEYALDDGELRRRLEPPVADGRVSDLALGPDGTLYAADPRTGRIDHLPPGVGQLEVLVDEGPIVSAQGMAATPDGRFLFVADYVRGVARVDLETREVRLLPTPENLLTSGIDGLVIAGDSLVGIVNGLRPHRVLRLRLDPSRSRVVEGSVLERAHPLFDEPTLGVVVDGALHYVANSQYRHFDADGTPDLEQLREPAVLRLALPWLSEP